MTCALYEDQQTTKTFTIEGVTDENYYTALLGYPPTMIASDQVVKTFANHPITLKTSIKYHKEYDRDTEQEILALLEKNDNAKDFSWESKIEDADEIEKAQDTADHKRRVFVVQPEPPYDIGDLWTQGETGDLMRCRVARASGSYDSSDWEKASK